MQRLYTVLLATLLSVAAVATPTPPPTRTPRPTATVTRTPTKPRPTATKPRPTATKPRPTSRPSGGAANYDKNGDGKVTCADFKTQAQAQAALNAGYKKLDGNDGDGKACESLP